MSNKIIDGKLISLEIREKVKKFGDQLKNKTGKVPGLAVVLVGENPASRVYVKNKIEKTIEVDGFNSIEHKLSEKVSENELIDLVDKLNNDENVQGILVQLPLPEHVNSDKPMTIACLLLNTLLTSYEQFKEVPIELSSFLE